MSQRQIVEDKMTIITGSVVTHNEYLNLFRQPRQRPVVWNWSGLTDQCKMLGNDERGIAALSIPDSETQCDVVPGMSIAIQVVEAGGETRSHTHSWWHLYMVVSGSSTVELDVPSSQLVIARNDILLIPAWCPHRFDNRAGKEDLVLLRMQNMPLLSRLSNLASREPDSAVSHIYADEPQQ